ncbi:serine hydrolase [Massilia sp. CF038]|uniref:serine hydrolase domain-containing protein n=1 Tax=Massilia sp. CF038 TaxID=1881045 RepID=UPI001E419382|nr:serine hydrolase domain-containing protein [Massilia sp. CF038]
MMHASGRRLYFFVACAALLLAGCGGGGSTPTPTPDPVALPLVSMSPAGSTQAANAEVDAYVQAKMTEGKIPGLSLAVLENGRLLYAKSYGYADLDARLPLRPEHRMEIGSISKTFAAAGAMLLVDEGKLDLDAKVSTYIGPVIPSWEAITVRHLLNHSSGLPEYPTDASRDIVEGKRILSEEEILAIYKTFPSTRTPGLSWSYSNVGYDVLGIILSRVSGRHYGAYLRDKMFTPLGMREIRIMAPNESPAGNATGYAMVGSKLVADSASPGLRNYGSLAASGVEASLMDMVKYDAALRGNTLLRQSSLDAMFSISISTGLTTGPTKAPANFGLGWFLALIGSEHKSFHSGGMPGYICNFIHYQEAGITVIVLTNQGFQGQMPQTVTQGVARMYRPSLPE